MKSFLRFILTMGGKAVTFVLGHPDDNPATAQVANRLVELVDRGEALALQQRTGQVAYSAATDQKADLRMKLENDLAALVGIARAAAKTHPDLTVHRRMPARRTNEPTFLTTVRVATTEARAAMALLVPFGFSEALLASLTTGLEAYDATLDRQASALAMQVGAGAELEAVASAIMDVVKNLDAVYRVRFQDDRELMAAWKSARNVPWRIPVRAQEPESTPAPEIAPPRSA